MNFRISGRPIEKTMTDTPPDHFDVTVTDAGDVVDNRHDAAGFQERPWVGIRFECCGVYTRIYRNREGTAYRGVCPRCARPVTLKVGPGGTDARFFSAR